MKLITIAGCSELSNTTAVMCTWADVIISDAELLQKWLRPPGIEHRLNLQTTRAF
jgi:hypothetical protein